MFNSSSGAPRHSLNELWTVEETARYLRVSPGTLYNWTTQGKGPKRIRIGGRTLYAQSDVLDFIQRGRC